MKTKANLQLALVQFSPVWKDVPATLAKLDSLLKDIPYSDLIVLPEMFSTGFVTSPMEIQPKEIRKSLDWMLEKSVQTSSAVVGSLPFKDSDRFFNRLFWVENGRIIHTYDKRHLFSYGGEDKEFSYGKNRVSIFFKGWKIFPVICYDIRFPVWCRNDEDYDVLLTVASWPEIRIAHWNALLQARAIENQSFVVAVNRVGLDGNGIHHNGHSGIISPSGEWLYFDEGNEKVIIGKLSRDELEIYRKKFPFLKDRDNFSII